MLVAEAGLDVRLTGRLLNIGSAARFAVPGVRLGVGAPSLHTDRCTRNGLAVSATGSARPFRPQRATLAGHITRKLSTNSADADKKDSQPKG